VGGGSEADDLIARAREAAAAHRWMESLDLASQALAVDPQRDDAAALVGVARHRLNALGQTGPELRQLTVIAVDMCGSTAIAAGVGPERYRQLMLELYEACVDAVTRYEGRVTKYVGDGVLAQFGHPIAHEDDARRAVLASLALLDDIAARGDDWERRFGTRVQVRIGLDTGTVAVGPMDASPWSADEIAGDPPNVASRVQATADPMSVRVTEATFRLIEGWFQTEPAGVAELRNFPRPVALHRVVGPTEAETRLEAQVRPVPPLVDRVAELGMLRGAWQEVAEQGSRRVVGVTGQAGIGKSRLAEQVVGAAAAAGARTVLLACSSLDRNSPFRPIARALQRLVASGPGPVEDPSRLVERLTRRLEIVPGRRVPVDRSVSVLAWLLGLTPPPDLEPEALRRLVLEVLVDLVEAFAAERPVVLYADDVDTADPSTIAVLEALLARPADVPMLVVLTGRGPLPPELTRDVEGVLQGLPSADADRLARSVAGALNDETVRRIVQRCDGVPFYVEELAAAAGENRREVRAEPVALSAFVAARLDELGPDLRRLVSQIAIAGPEVRLDVLGGVTRLTPEVLDRQVAELALRRIVRRSHEATGEMVRFRHDVMREVAYATQLETRRSELHAQVAHALAALPEEMVRPEELARHFALGGDHASAAPAWLQAGQAALGNGANREAIELVEHALASLDRLPEGPARTGAELGAQLGLGSAASTVEGFTSPRAHAAFDRAVELGVALADDVAIFPALWGTWSYWFVLGEHHIAAALADRCVTIAEQQPDERFRWAAAAILGYQRLYAGDFPGACRELELGARAIGTERIADFPHDMGIVSQAALGVALLFLGERDAAAAAIAKAYDAAEALDPGTRQAALTRAWVANWVAWHAELSGDPERALAMADRALGIAQEHGYATWLAAGTLHRSIALCSLGRHEEGLPVLAAVVDAWQSAGRDAAGVQRHPVLMTSYYAGRLAEALLQTGDRDGAQRWVDELLRTSAATGERFWDARLRALGEQIESTMQDQEV
jgi:class 3 adenylate cyclase/tetratricopeptide (TPR) repeat protein